MQATPSPTATTPTIQRPATLAWKPDWATAQQHHIDWWNHKGMVLWVTSGKDERWEDIPSPPQPQDMFARWYDPAYRVARDEHGLSGTYFGGDSFPMLSTWAGAGDLAAYIGSPLECAPNTIWFHPLINDPPEDHPPLRIDYNSPALQKAIALIDLAVARSRGRYLVSQPDIVENIDILASLRGTQTLLMDMIERPDWIVQRVSEINQAFFEAFDLFYEKIKDARGGNTFVFNLWGPGKTAKVQCDACSMFGPEMFRRFVTPALTEQCQWLDYAMYHLDGQECLVNLDALLEIEPLQAIEWTPKLANQNQDGGNPKWYELYRRILKAGKSVQAIAVKYDEVIPLLDAVGSQGMYIITESPNEEATRKLEEKVQAYR